MALLVNNAGILGPVGPSWEVDLDDWWTTIEVNLFGTLVYTRLPLSRMVDRGVGRIINITSQAGAFRWPVVSAYLAIARLGPPRRYPRSTGGVTGR